jgi:hypothetical protein
MTNGQDKELLHRIRRELDDSVESLDEETRARLTSVRHKVLAHGKRLGLRAWLPAGGLALASLLLIAVIAFKLQPAGPEMDFPVVLLENQHDLELVGTIENFEILEDLEFYYWLEEGAEGAG